MQSGRWRTLKGAIVGAGTVLNERMLGAAIDAGAQFIVSPGLTETLGRAAIASGVPFLPGVANAGDIMRGLDLGLDRFKFFPAEASGGLAGAEGAGRALRRRPLLPDRRHHARKARRSGLPIRRVLCVGGSWMVQPAKPIWPQSATRRTRAAALGG